MKSEDKNNQAKKYQKKIIYRIIILIIYVSFLFYIFYLMMSFGFNPFIAILLLFFAFLVVFGPLLKGIRKSYYSRLFPDKRKSKSKSRRYNEESRKQNETYRSQAKKKRQVNLNFKYRKPIIRKCENCGIFVPSFAKKCPICRKPILE